MAGEINWRGWTQDESGKWHAPGERPPGPAQPAKPPPPKSSKAFWIVVAMVVGGIWAVGAHESGDRSSESPPSSLAVTVATVRDRSSEAFGVCKRFVTDRLKAPATAKFRSFAESSVSGDGDGPYLVVGAVDSQNGFGALLRSGFFCKLTLVGSTWRLDDVAID